MKNINNTYLKKEEENKEIKKYKRKYKAVLLLLIVTTIVLLVQFSGDMINKIENIIYSDNDTVNYKGFIVNKTLNTNETIQICEEPTWAKSIIFLMDKLFLYPTSFWTKFFIFLGAIYIIQIIFGLAFDVIELILLSFVAIKRLIKWIIRKITRKNNKGGENLKKIEELYLNEKIK